MESIAKTLVAAGLALVALGLILWAGAKVGLGRLPGDFHWQGRRVSFYFPLATSLLISLLLTGAFWIVSRLRRH